MIDLLVAALRCDATRVSTFMLANALTAFRYEELGVSTSHHGTSHHLNLPKSLADLAKIDRWEVGELAALLDRLARIDEGGVSLLDSSLVLFSNEIEDGNEHRHSSLPVILAGRAGGALAPGKRIVFRDERPFANVHLTLLRAAGVEAEQFGDSTGTLSL